MFKAGDTNGTRQYIEKSVFTLKPDKYITIKENFSITEATRSAVVVNLISKPSFVFLVIIINLLDKNYLIFVQFSTYFILLL